MALEEFENQKLSAKDKGIIASKSITNYFMGVLLLCAGIFLFTPMVARVPQLQRYDIDTLRMLGAVCCIYGIFRIYRGYKKNYFR